MEEYRKNRLCHVVANRQIAICRYPIMRVAFGPFTERRIRPGVLTHASKHRGKGYRAAVEVSSAAILNFSLDARGLYSCNSGDVPKFGMIQRTCPPGL